LTSLDIPNSVTSIGEDAFRGCTELTSVTIGNSVTTIGEEAFYDCTGLISLTIPNSVTSIGYKAFYGCENIHSMTIGSGVISIESSQCSPLKVIWLANTPPTGASNLNGRVNYVANDNYSLSGTKYVYSHLSSMFDVDGIVYVPVNPSERTCDIIDCKYDSSASTINVKQTASYRGIAMSVQNMRPYSFYGNTNIQNLTIDWENDIPEYAFYGCSNIPSVEIPETAKNIGEYAFYGDSSLKSVTLNNVGNIENSAFCNCSSLENICLSNTGYIGANAFENAASGLPATLTVSNSVTNIGDGAFYNCSALESISLNNTGNMGASAFLNDTALKTATICNTGNVGDYAFYGCSALESISLNNIGDICASVFRDDTALKTATICNAGGVGDYAFSGCTSLSDISLKNAGSVGKYAFKNCTAAEFLTIAPTVTQIVDYAFSGCSSIADVTIEDGNTGLKIGSNIGPNNSIAIFADCPLDEVYIGRKLDYDSSSSKGYSPFYRNTSLRSVEITDAETLIYDNEFYGCTNLQNVKIGDGVTSFGMYAFSGCSKIESFEFGRSVMSIGEEAFSDCTAMTDLISHNPTPPSCGNEALDDINKWNCTLHVPEDALSAYQEAEQWKNFFFIDDDIIIEKYFGDGNLYYHVTSKDDLTCEVVSPDIVPEDSKVSEVVALSDDSSEDLYVAIPSKVTYKEAEYAVKGVAENALSDKADITKLSIPESVEYINDNAFAACSNLNIIEIGAVNPPAVVYNSFSEVTYSQAALLTPAESVDLYTSAEVWKKFGTILDIEKAYPQTIELDRTESALLVNSTLQLSATVLPSEALDQSVVWSSSDDAVATVSDAGLVTAVGAGVATITATSGYDSSVYASCEITVAVADGVDAVADDAQISVMVNDHKVIIRKPADMLCHIYSLTGALICDTDETVIDNLEDGIYIVVVGDTATKVIVR
jgi:hypothetical protein